MPSITMIGILCGAKQKAPYTIKLQLQSAVGSSRWESKYSNGTVSQDKVISLTTATSALSTTSEKSNGGVNVNISVHKLNNSGVAQDNGNVTWLRNGSISNGPTSFSVSTTPSLNYTINSCVPGDVLEVQIVEG